MACPENPHLVISPVHKVIGNVVQEKQQHPCPPLTPDDVRQRTDAVQVKEQEQGQTSLVSLQLITPFPPNYRQQMELSLGHWPPVYPSPAGRGPAVQGVSSIIIPIWEPELGRGADLFQAAMQERSRDPGGRLIKVYTASEL